MLLIILILIACRLCAVGAQQTELTIQAVAQTELDSSGRDTSIDLTRLHALQVSTRSPKLLPDDTNPMPYKHGERCEPPDDVHHGTYCNARGARKTAVYHLNCGRYDSVFGYSIFQGKSKQIKGRCPDGFKCYAGKTSFTGKIWAPSTRSDDAHHDRPYVECRHHSTVRGRPPERRQPKWARRKSRTREAERASTSATTAAAPTEPVADADADAFTGTNELVWHEYMPFDNDQAGPAGPTSR